MANNNIDQLFKRADADPSSITREEAFELWFDDTKNWYDIEEYVIEWFSYTFGERPSWE